MALSIEIPSAILKISMVDGLIGTPKYPMSAAVITKGKMLGINETITILAEESSRTSNKVMVSKASRRLVIKFLVRY